MTGTSTPTRRRALRAAMAAVTTATILAGGFFAGAGAANASPWDPHVRLQGTVDCGVIPNGHVQGLWIWTPQDGGRWYGYSGTRYSESYSRDLWNVPYWGTAAQVDIYCSGAKAHQSFGLSRPTFGATATRNLWFRF